MFEFISIINAVVCLALFCLSLFAILHPDVNDGIVIKCGLIFLTVGFGTLAYKLSGMCDLNDIQSLEKALLFVHVGAIILVIGYALRVMRSGHKLQRISDWLGPRSQQEIKWPKLSRGNDGS